MTAIVMGDVSAIDTLECAHRRQLLAARALNERSLLIRGLTFPCTKTSGDVYIDDLVILSVLQLSVVHVGSSPIEMQRADAFFDFSDAYKCGQVRQHALGRAFGRAPGWRLRDTRTPPRTPF